jgi:ubiquinone/menaquinone biosynthesis C-methylase UbiE
MSQNFGKFNQGEVEEYEKEYFDYQQSREGIDITFYGNWQKDFAKLLIEIADLESNPGKYWETVLDVGCACGINLRGIDELGIFSKIYGTDISNYIINTVIPTLPFHANDYVDFFCTPSWDLSMIDDNDVDLITCTHVLEHLPDEEKLNETLKEFQRVLHPEGKIIIIIPVVKEEIDDPNTLGLHKIMHETKWWNKVFSKYFKSESFKARIAFKKSKLKPDRLGDKTFYENYPAWEIFRLISK